MATDFGKCPHRELASETNRIPVPGHYLSGGIVRPDRRSESRKRPASSMLRV